jgi:imidazolonepropionase-like amidohydrolase
VAAAEDSFVLRAGRVYPVTADVAGPIAPGVVIVRNGKIVAVGDDALALPADLPVLDFPDATVMPGLVSAANELGGRHQGEESVAAGYRAIDAYRPFDRFDAILAAGVTTVHLSPGDHRLVTGQGAVVKLGGPMAGRVLSDRSDLTVNLDASAYDPPEQVEYPIPASADVAIEPSKPQRPASRLGQILAIEEHLDAALSPQADAEFDAHRDALTRAWNEKLPWRVQTERPADIAEAIALLKERGRTGYLVGGAEAVDVAERIDESRLPLVYRVRTSLRAIERDLGSDPDRLDDELANLKRLRGVPLALAGASGEATGDLRLAAARALAAGLDEATVLEAITVVPAQILGVADRVGTLAPGKDADIIVLSGDPLETSSHVLRAYIGGQIAFDAPRPRATVIRAGTIWVDDETRIENGSVLIEDGKITAVGHRVPHPPFAAVIDAGPAGFVTPGFVDAHGHLGLEGDRSALATELDLGWLIGAPDLAERRVARAGVTTTLVAPYRAANGGSQVAAIRTAGDGRADRVVRGTAAVFFDVTDQEAIGAGEQIKKRLDAGKKYLETWLKFEKELAEWKEKIAKGEPVEVKPAAQDVKKTEGQEDPITGTWSVTVSGGPIPEPQTGTLRARLDGDSIEGRLDIPGQPGDVKVVATFDGKHISGYIEIDTGGMGTLTLEADLIETDHIVGTISFQGLSIDLDAVRTDKKAVDFKVVKRRKRGKDGRPLPPEVDQKLEPLRSVLEKKIPLLVAARTAAQIKEVLDTADAFEARVVLLGAEESAVLAERLAEKKVGVIAPTSVLRWEHNRPYHQSDDLSRRKVPVAFQSDREDGARNLPLVAMHAVERGLSADQALAALTCHAARMFQLDDRIGAIREGMDADLVIFTGHPFEAGSRIKRVIAAGKEVR